MKNFWKRSGAVLFGVVLTGGMVSGAGASAIAAELIPVIPNAPIVDQPYGYCNAEGKFVIEPATVTLPKVQNGRWLDDDTEAGFVETKTFHPAPGEYSDGMITAEGYFKIPESPGGRDDYRLENGVAYYNYVINGVEPQNCGIAQNVYKPSLHQASWKCSNGTLGNYWGYIYAPSRVGMTWKLNGSTPPASNYFAPSATAKTYVYTAVPKLGYFLTGQTTYTMTANALVKPVC